MNTAALQALADTLEKIIDDNGFAEVSEALALVCSNKADHLRSNWQDKPTADAWDMLASRMLRTEYLARQNGFNKD